MDSSDGKACYDWVLTVGGTLILSNISPEIVVFLHL